VAWLIKKDVLLENKRLFKEIIEEKSTTKLVTNSKSSPFVKYRRYKDPKAYTSPLENPQRLLGLVRVFLNNLGINLRVVELTSFDVERIIAIYFANLNNHKFTESQLELIASLRKTSIEDKFTELEKIVEGNHHFDAGARDPIALAIHTPQNKVLLSNSKFKHKSDLNKSTQQKEVVSNMKKEKNYRQEFERKYSEQNHKLQIQEIVHETRENLFK